MSALPPVFAQLLQAPPVPGEAQLLPLTANQLDAVLAVEQGTHAHPWTLRHFSDCLNAGHLALGLWGDDSLLGYLVAMPGVQEAHLLNITVAPAHQGRGWARLLLDALALWARELPADQLWLEVRASNVRAHQVYLRHGFEPIGLRKGYYPLRHNRREDAIVMRRHLNRVGSPP